MAFGIFPDTCFTKPEAVRLIQIRIFTVFLGLFGFIGPSVSATQNSQSGQLKLSDSLHYYAIIANGHYDREDTDVLKYVQANHRMAEYYLKRNILDSVKTYLTKGKLALESSRDEHDILLADNAFLQGEYHLDNFEGTAAQEHFEECLRLRKNHFGDNHPETAMALLGIGKVSLFIHPNFVEADTYLSLALEKLKSHANTDSIYFRNLYYYLGVLYSDNHQFTKAFWYGKAALNLANKESINQDVSFIAKCHNALAIAYYRDLQNTLAIGHFLQAIANRRLLEGYAGPRTALYYLNIATCYRALGDFNRANQYNTRALKLYQGFSNAEQGIADCYYNRGSDHLLQQHYDSARFYFKKSIKLKRSIQKDVGSAMARALINLGKAYMAEEQLDSALAYYHEAWTALDPEFNSNDLLANPDSIEDKHISIAHEILVNKGSVLYEKFHSAEPSSEILGALNCFLYADSLMVNVWKDFEDVPSKLHLSTHLQDAQEITLALLHTLYSKTQNKEYAKKALLIMERNKQRVLMENLDFMHSNKVSNASDSLLNLESVAQQKVLFLRHLFELEKNRTDRNEVDIKMLHAQLVNATRKLIFIKDALRLRTATAPGSLLDKREALQLNTDLTYVAYFWGNDAVYGCTFGNEKWDFFKIDDKEKLEEDIVLFNSLIKKGIEIETMQEDYTDYINSGHRLFKALLNPVISIHPLSGEHDALTIIPDGLLASLSFGALPVSAGHHDEANYSSIPYLTREISINYAYSIGFLQLNKRTSRENQKLLAFAYAGEKLSQQGSEETTKSSRALAGSSKEIMSISKIWEGTYLEGKKASLDVFKKTAPQYDMLHIAIHGKADVINASNNMLVFPSSASNLANQDTLYSYEIPGLDLKAQLVVLSACETGVGKSFKGEGTYSIARSFAMGGCPSIVTSLWNVNDAPTASLMKAFYQGLKENNPIDLALQQAQRTYLESADKFSAHPSNWAAFVSLGDPSPISNEPSTSPWLWAMGVVTIIAVSVLLLGPRLFRKSHSYS